MNADQQRFRKHDKDTNKYIVQTSTDTVTSTCTCKHDVNTSGVLERVTSHPLQHHDSMSPFLGSSSGSSVTHESYASSSINTASLLQSAVRSILDSPIASNNNSDDENSPIRNYEKVKRFGESLSLMSLQKQIIPAMPEEQDRKRFIGCLAAVLANTYSYEVDSENTDEINGGDRASSLKENERDRYSEQYCTDSMDPRRMISLLSLTTNGNSNISESNSFDTFLSCGSEYMPDDLKKKDSPYKYSQKKGSSASSLDSTNHNRIRRHAVLSRLLLSSAELFQLDKNHAKCFLPMLSNILTPSKNESRTQTQQFSNEDTTNMTFLERKLDEIEYLRPFLESLSPGAGLRCLAMFLIQYLLRSEEGYDSRVRHAVKTLGVLLIMHDMELDEESYISSSEAAMFGHGTTTTGTKNIGIISGKNDDFDARTKATRYFESLENVVASKLIQLSREQIKCQDSRMVGENGATRILNNALSRPSSRVLSGENFIRGLKIGGTAVAAGTLFAVTGGLAAPGIAAGVAAISGGTAISAAAAAVLTSTVALTAIFGVGGGGLAAYKMQRRTVGLTEFEFVKEDSDRKATTALNTITDDSAPEAELFSTVCLSGWLRDNCDFQRPWGVQPSRPRITNRTELLERFYSVYSPEHVPKCSKILASWKGEEAKLWHVLRQKYGRDPSHLFPLEPGLRAINSLVHEQREIVDRLFHELGCGTSKDYNKQQKTPLQRLHVPKRQNEHISLKQTPTSLANSPYGYLVDESLHGPHADDLLFQSSFSEDSSGVPINSTIPSEEIVNRNETTSSTKSPKHIATVWDYRATYGGELYTVRWETDLLTELCDSVTDLAFDVVSGGTAHLLKFTALSTLLSAVALPYALVNAANMIDATWTLVIERADEAGKELARSLLFSTAGNRPVTLIGYSFGARAIYSCLKELARFQQRWELMHEKRKQAGWKNPIQRGTEYEEGSDAFYMNMREPASIVEDVVLMGLPNHLSLSSWKACRQIVAGRLTHCFSQRDLILSLMFQIKKFGLKPGTFILFVLKTQ